MLDPLRLAVGTFTVIPVGPVRVEPPTAGAAMLLAPVAAVPLGVVAGLLAWLGGGLGWPALLTGLLVVGSLAIGTRALHLDGLADCVDGLGSGADAPRALAIMRRGDIGPMGVVALVLVLGLQAVAAGSLAPLTLGVLVVASRAAVAIGCATGVPAARTDGLGAAVAATVPPVIAGAVWLAVAVIAASVVDPWWQGGVVAVIAAGAAVLLVRHAVRRLGGITGDVLGAAVEISLTVLLVGALA